ncbi:MAG TPA: DUF4011 domain-containing protein, partial [Gemmatimonadaceae bacterium]|nr:DUF4011 domain-containing protein [Gemmatimonadaceae bacterium]
MPTPESSHSDASTASSSAPPGLQARTEAALTLWRTRLLDLTKRNRALSFRPTKVSTVTIVGEQPAEVYRQLCIDGRTMRFRPTLPSVAKKGDSEAHDTEALDAEVHDVEVHDAASPRTADPHSEPQLFDTASDRLIDADDSDAPQAPELDFTPYDPATLDARHTDDVLETLATPEALDKSLRRLDEQARATIEEQGVNVLFLALGMLHYTESAESDVVLRAPLVMVPVSLERKSARTGYTIEATDDDAIVNPALAEYLRREYGVTLPDLHS